MEGACVYGSVFVCFWAVMCLMAQAEYLQYTDPSQPIEVRITDLLERMSLEEKIGQMTQIERTVASIEVMQKYFIGKLCCDYSLRCSLIVNKICICMMCVCCFGFCRKCVE